MKGTLRSIAKQLGPHYFVRKMSVFKRADDGILTGYCFDRAPKRQHFYIWAFCLPLYVPQDVLNLQFGQRIGGGSASWYLDPSGSNVPDILPLLQSKEACEITSIDTPSAFLQRFEKDALCAKPNSHTQEAVAYSYAKVSKLAECVQILRLLLDRFSPVDYTRDWQVAQVARARAMLQAIERDCNTVNNLLCEWEMTSRRNLLL